MTTLQSLKLLLRRMLWIQLRIPRLLLAAPQLAVGGQAVMDGVMMRGPHGWALAVRRQDGEIAVQYYPHESFASRHGWARIPLVRGVVALLESLVIGMRALFVSSEYAIADIEAEENAEGHTVAESELAAALTGSTTAAGGVLPVPHDGDDDSPPDASKLGAVAIALSMLVALAFSIGLFKVVPVTLATFMPIDRDAWGFVLIEAAIKFAIFCVYLVAVGFMPDMRRVFQYHSAEHKAINAWERGVELVPKAVNAMSRIHVRCGTAFIVWLFLIGILVFRGAQLTFLEGATRWEIIAARPVLLPIIAGLSFEILRFAGKHDTNSGLRVLLAPGLWFQRLTTRECNEEQCEVAIASLTAVLDNEPDAESSSTSNNTEASLRKDEVEALTDLT